MAKNDRDPMTDNICPFCKSDNIHGYDFFPEGETGFRVFNCRKCNKNFRVDYKLIIIDIRRHY
jgi:transposase-like protein